jgi:hydroxypyruvate isomerase
MPDLSRLTVNCSIIFTELALLDRPGAAAAAGFSAVEFWWPFTTAVPPSSEVDEFVESLDAANVALTGLNLFAGDMAAGERGILSSPDRESEFHENFEVVKAIAARTGCRTFNALYGNRLPGYTPHHQDKVALERLSSLEEFTKSTGSQIVLEPLSGVENYPLLTAREALVVIEDLQQTGSSTTVRLLADLYHLAVNGSDVSQVIEQCRSLIGHVQIADAPGRGEPGTGDLSLRRWIDELQASGYGGMIGLEYRPSSTSSRSFGWIQEFGS